MEGEATWWVLAGVILGTTAIACVFALTDPVRVHLRARRERRAFALGESGLGSAWPGAMPAVPAPPATPAAMSGMPVPVPVPVPTTGPVPVQSMASSPARAFVPPAAASSPGPTPAFAPAPVVSAPPSAPAPAAGVAPPQAAPVVSAPPSVAAQAAVPAPAGATPGSPAAASSVPPYRAVASVSTGSRGQTGPDPTASVYVQVLGPFQVRAPGVADPAYRRQLSALVAMAAVCPDGIPPEALPELLPNPSAAATASHYLRMWLGADSDGAPRLRETNGRWHLDPEVKVDWREFQALATATDPDPAGQRLGRALALIRGELLSGVTLPVTAQQALTTPLAEVNALVLAAVRRDIELAQADEDPARAEWALRQGLMLLPREESLWQLRLGLHR